MKPGGSLPCRCGRFTNGHGPDDTTPGGFGSNVIPWQPRVKATDTLRQRVPRLLTCSFELHDRLRCLNGFVAMVTDDEEVFRRRVMERFGPRAFDRLLLGVGDGWHDAISDMLVSGDVADMLETSALDPGGEIARGFEVTLEVGFLNG